MSTDKTPITPAIRFLRDHGVEFVPHQFQYQERGGTSVSSRELGVSEHAVIKTLIMETDRKDALVVLMHGDLQVSTKNLARFMSVKSVSPCTPETANRLSGYQVGGTSPFGLRTPLPLYMQSTIADLERIYINGGGKGFLIEIATRELIRVLKPIHVDVSTERKA